MASTSFTVYAKPRTSFSAVAARSSGLVSYIPLRAVSGIYTSGLTVSKGKKNGKPSSSHPLGYVSGDRSKPVMVDESWSRFLGLEIAGRKLGGVNYPTLPDVAQFVTKSQVDALLTQAQDQMAQANAQTLASLLQIVQNAGLVGAAQVPPPVLARQETNPQPVAAPLVEGGGGAGAGE